jgi:DNA replication protein DnaC
VDDSTISTDDEDLCSVSSEYHPGSSKSSEISLKISDVDDFVEDETYPEYLIEDFDTFDVVKDLSKVILGTTNPSKIRDQSEEITLKNGIITTHGHKEYVPYYSVAFYWEMAYPHLFPYGTGGPCNKNKRPRTRPLDDAQYDMHLLLEASQRFVNVMPWLCGRYRYRTSRACNRVAYMASQFGSGEQRIPTVRDLNNVAEFGRAGQNRVVKSAVELETEQLIRQLTSFGHQLKTSAMYIKQKRQQLLCMLQAKDLTTPTWFLTLSSADLYWPELWIAIKPTLNYESAALLTLSERKKLLDLNPTMACRMFKERIDCVLKFILIQGKHKPLGKVLDWWFRVEFQSRGSLHVHSLLWTLLHLKDGTELNGDVQAELFRRCLLKPEKEVVPECSQDDAVSTSSSNNILFNDSNSIVSENNEMEYISYDGSILSTNVLPNNGDECKAMFSTLIDRYLSASFPTIDTVKVVENVISNKTKEKPKCKRGKKHTLPVLISQSNESVEVSTTPTLKSESALCSVRFSMIPRDSMEHPSLSPCDFEINSVQETEDICNLIRSVNCHDPKHTQSCFKYSKDASCQVCRYHFPRCLCQQTRVWHRFNDKYRVMEVVVELKRNHAYINNYNPWLMLHHRGNMDCQFICNASGAATYASMYVSKPESPDLAFISEKASGRVRREMESGIPDSLQKKLYLTSMAVYSSREVCLQEICWYLLGYPFVFLSRTFLKVNLLPPTQHCKILLSESQRKKLPLDAPAFIESDGIDKLVKEYMNLDPTQVELLADLSLYDFLTCYSRSSSVTPKDSDLYSVDGTRCYRKRSKSKILKVTPYIKFDESCYKSCFAMLLAHRQHYTCIEQCGEPTNSVAFLNECIENDLMCSSYITMLHKHRRQSKILSDINTKSNIESKKITKRVLRLDLDNENDANEIRRGRDDDSEQEYELHQQVRDPLDYNHPVNNGPQYNIVDNAEYLEASNYVKKIKDAHEMACRQEQADFLPGTADEHSLNNPSCRLTKAMNSSIISFSTAFKSLNDKQKACFHIVAAHLNDDHSCKVNSASNGQLRMLLSGPAGTGKTFLIHCIFAYAQLKFPYDGSRFGPVLKLAPTGVAAHNIRGNTIDSVMQFWSFTNKNSEVSVNTLKDLQSNLGRVKLIIFDEYSMIGVQKLGKINKILNLAKTYVCDHSNVDDDLIMGGVHMVLAGDNCQLPSVKTLVILFCEFCRKLLINIKLINWF